MMMAWPNSDSPNPFDAHGFENFPRQKEREGGERKNRKSKSLPAPEAAIAPLRARPSVSLCRHQSDLHARQHEHGGSQDEAGQYLPCSRERGTPVKENRPAWVDVRRAMVAAMIH